jgi:hypothetical protein
MYRYILVTLTREGGEHQNFERGTGPEIVRFFFFGGGVQILKRPITILSIFRITCEVKSCISLLYISTCPVAFVPSVCLLVQLSMLKYPLSLSLSLSLSRGHRYSLTHRRRSYYRYLCIKKNREELGYRLEIGLIP